MSEKIENPTELSESRDCDNTDVQSKYLLSPAQIGELRTRFRYHKPKEDQAERYQILRDAAYHYARLLMRNCPESRELSLALTNLEECVMFANAAIARRE